jgi:hypothetical protein
MAELMSIAGCSSIASRHFLRGGGAAAAGSLVEQLHATSTSRPAAGTTRRGGVSVRAATEAGGGTRYVGGKRVKVLPVGDKSAKVRDKVPEGPEAVKLLSRVEQLRLLSKAEKAGLLSAAESFGFSLSSIEKLGLLSKAEDFGVLSAATDRNTPAALLTAALVLLLAGPVIVYLVPEDSTPLVVLQVVVGTLTALAGSAAFAASNFVSSLQKSD